VLKFLLFSLLLATFFLPAAAARSTRSSRALWSLLGIMFLVEAGYALFLYLYPALL
jgi:hypothetical protein